MMSAHDEKLVATHISPGQGMVLRGSNPRADADLRSRHAAPPTN